MSPRAKRQPKVADLDEQRERRTAKQHRDAKAALTDLLCLPSVGLSVEAAQVVGRGSQASATLHLSDGSVIDFETLRDVATGSRLALEVTAATGAVIEKPLTNGHGLKAVRLVRAVADWRETESNDDIARDWGISFLQEAVTLTLDMNDGRQRWDAFTNLKDTDAVQKARSVGRSVAREATVLEDEASGSRYVRCGWFQSYVREQGTHISPQELNVRMERVGWQRPNSQSRIKATRPKLRGQLALRLYVVPRGWEER